MVERDEVRRAYDEVAETYASHRSGDDEGMAILASFLESLPPSPRVLDAGCGQGTPVLERLDAEGAAVGVDFSREQLTLARESVPGGALAQADMTALPFAADSFDAAVAFWSLIHVPLESHPAVLEEFARVLRPGGRVLVCEASDRWCGRNEDWLETGVGMEWHMAGATATRGQLVEVGLSVTDTWTAPESLADDADRSSPVGDRDGDGSTEAGDAEEDWPWTFLAATLER